MSNYEMSLDLEGHYHVQQTDLINHPQYSQPVLLIRNGWAKRGRETVWYETKIETIKDNT